MKLKYLTHMNRRVLPESTDPNSEFAYVDIAAVSGDGGIQIPSDMTRFGSAPSRARRLAPPHSTVVSTVRTYLRAVAHVPSSAVPLVFSTGFAVLEARPELDDRFLTYACRSEPFIESVVARSNGVSYPAINPTDLGDISIPFPNIEDQRRIADFLDAETARIDGIRRLRERQMSLLDMRFDSLLAAISWQPDDPVMKAKRVVSKVTSGPRGWGDYVSDHGSLFIRIANVSGPGIDLDLTDSVFVDPPNDAERKRTQTCVGDVLLSITADIGSVAVLDKSAIGANVSQHVSLLRPIKGACLPRWLAYTIRIPRVHQSLLMASYGGTKVGLGLADVANLSLPMPGHTEQQRRCHILDEAWSATQGATEALVAQVRLLAERKQALITAAVTGQFDVTTARGADLS